MNPFPLILSSPSGGGKTTITRLLLERRPDVGYSISCTTRAPRHGETNGKDYFFLSKSDFAEKRERGEFAESAEVHGNWYGTLRSQVDVVLGQHKHVLMDIDVQGARQFRAAYPESVHVFLFRPAPRRCCRGSVPARQSPGTGFGPGSGPRAKSCAPLYPTSTP
jgi:guanylate kinase